LLVLYTERRREVYDPSRADLSHLIAARPIQKLLAVTPSQ
jgi:hypothetical protein